MDARTLENKMNYLGMERAARKVLIDEKLAKAEEVAMMTCVEVCEKLLESYEVVSCEDEDITIVKKEDMKTYNDIVRFLSR
jgi:enolase